MISNEQTPERELTLIHLSLYLQEFPKSAYDLAIDHYAKYLNLAVDYKRLRKDFENLQQENIKLRSKKTHRTVSLPSVSHPNPNQRSSTITKFLRNYK